MCKFGLCCWIDQEIVFLFNVDYSLFGFHVGAILILLCPFLLCVSDSMKMCTESFSGGLTPSAVSSLSLSLSPALSPEKFENLWLQLQTLPVEQGNETTVTVL